MPDGKPAGVRCIQLSNENLCLIFGHADRPKVCQSLKPSTEMCGKSNEEAYSYLEMLEKETL